MAWTGRCLCLFVVVAVLVAVGTPASAETPYPGGTWEPAPPSYGVFTVDEVRFPARDGVELAATVVYPADLTTGVRVAEEFAMGREPPLQVLVMMDAADRLKWRSEDTLSPTIARVWLHRDDISFRVVPISKSPNSYWASW